jgi:phosphoribosylaminoimidazole synthetase
MVDQAKADAFGKELGFGGYGGCFSVGAHDMVMTTDGVGTKLLIAEELGIFDTVGIDLVAMCANDLLCCGATPQYFMDYYATGDLQLDKSRAILSGVLKGCELAGCKLTGGETAQLNPMFLHNHWFDLAGFMVGEVLDYFDPEPVLTGDYLVGIPSSGFHSNGFTDIRIFYGEYEEWMLEPTRIYVDEVINNMSVIKACAHITGGGIFGNVDRVVDSDYITGDYVINFEFDKFWSDASTVMGYTRLEMLNKFNCGYGMVLVVSDPTKLDLPDGVVIGRVC